MISYNVIYLILFTQNIGLLKNTESDLCMKADKQAMKLTTVRCSSKDDQQLWDFVKVYPHKQFMSEQYLRQHGIK